MSDDAQKVRALASQFVRNVCTARELRIARDRIGEGPGYAADREAVDALLELLREVVRLASSRRNADRADDERAR